MKNKSALFALATLLSCAPTFAQPDPNWIDHDRARPLPPVVTPGAVSTPEKVGSAPSDAVVLFDGKDLSAWADMQGNPTKWIIRDGYMECVKGSGYIRTVQDFGDCQLHVEWATPSPAHGEGQGRGNSGVFFGRDRYEIQVLDCYGNKTYADGSAGSIYGQYPPLVNVCRPPGEWQTYDIIYTAPRFGADGKLLSPARITAFQNGVLIQNNVELTGPTSWINRAPYSPHPVKQPIAFQDHGNPVRFRNVWVRELDKANTQPIKPVRPQITLSKEQLERFVGKYGNIEVRRDGDNLTATIGGVKLTFFAETPTQFRASTTDVQLEFKTGAGDEVTEMVWSVGEGANTAKRSK
ncbi:MAG: hypothetical protein RLY20_34 [Verrucomicrobiota bacterium]|jgi:hypothetical protein